MNLLLEAVNETFAIWTSSIVVQYLFMQFCISSMHIVLVDHCLNVSNSKYIIISEFFLLGLESNRQSSTNSLQLRVVSLAIV